MQQETLIPVGNRQEPIQDDPPAPSTSTPQSSPVRQVLDDRSDDSVNGPRDRIPMLISSMGSVKTVYPKEATRDVLNGKVAYWLMDENGATLFQPKHLLTALKLTKKNTERVGDFTCLGGHQRLIEKKPDKTVASYRRKYISPELIGHGIYVSLMVPSKT